MAGPWLKKKESCKTCAFLDFDNIPFDTFHYDYYCKINNKNIYYPRKMGGRDKCPCYMTKAEYKKYEKENKKKIIDNYVYPQKKR